MLLCVVMAGSIFAARRVYYQQRKQTPAPIITRSEASAMKIQNIRPEAGSGSATFDVVNVSSTPVTGFQVHSGMYNAFFDAGFMDTVIAPGAHHTLTMSIQDGAPLTLDAVTLQGDKYLGDAVVIAKIKAIRLGHIKGAQLVREALSRSLNVAAQKTALSAVQVDEHRFPNRDVFTGVQQVFQIAGGELDKIETFANQSNQAAVEAKTTWLNEWLNRKADQ